MQQLKAKLTFFALRLISFLPFVVIYGLADLLFVVFYHITGYRKTVVFNNLRHSFPNKSDQELTKIAKDFYHHLSDLILESIKSFSISKKEILKRCHIINPEIAIQFAEKNQNVIVVLGHYGNWEWFGLSGSLALPPTVSALYRKIKNPVLDDLIRNNRGRLGLNLIGEKESYKKVPKQLNATDHWSLVAFIADQSANPKRAHWVDFLNQKTTFVQGPEKYALRTNCPIIYIDLHKVKRGHYQAIAEILVKNPSKHATEGEITKLFAKRIEQQIQQYPATWLWSHKRWKHKYSE